MASITEQHAKAQQGRKKDRDLAVWRTLETLLTALAEARTLAECRQAAASAAAVMPVEVTEDLSPGKGPKKK